MSTYEIGVGPTPAPARHAQYPWQLLPTSEHYFDVPLIGDEDVKKVSRTLYSSGRAWCAKHAVTRYPVTRRITSAERGGRGAAVRVWLKERI